MKDFRKYGGEGMLTMMVTLYNWAWKNEHAPRRRTEGIFQEVDKAEPGNYSGIALLSTVGKICTRY